MNEQSERCLGLNGLVFNIRHMEEQILVMSRYGNPWFSINKGIQIEEICT